jgi:hypothetical protein
MKEALDKVGRETTDIDNDKDVDKTDMYLHNRRGAIKKAIAKKKLSEAMKFPGKKSSSGEKPKFSGKKIKFPGKKPLQTNDKKVMEEAAVSEGKAAAAADKAIRLQRGKGNKINRKPTMEVDMKAQASPPPTHDGEDNSANVKV